MRAVATGLYLSRCRGKVEPVLDLSALARERSDRAAVVRVFDDLFDPEAVRRMETDVAEFALDAVVLAGNSSDHYIRSLSGGHVKERLAEAGVDPNRIVAANLLEQVALPHADDPAGAAVKASALLDVALLQAEERLPVKPERSDAIKSVLVLGATIEGLVAAKRLLQLGFGVTIVDRGDAAARLAGDGSISATAGYVLGHPKADVVSGASVTDGLGWVGDYEVGIATPEGARCLRVGGLLIADPEDTGWVEELRGHFRVDVDDDGHARSLDPATHPAETVDPGVMVVPLGRGGDLREQVAAADSAAMALVLRLAEPETMHYPEASSVDPELCGGCASCVKTCAFGACTIGADGLSHVDVRRCRGCGKCVVSCPVGARDVNSSPHAYLMGAVRRLGASEFAGPKVLGFLCGGCGYPAADRAGVIDGASYPASFLPLRVPCGGRLDTLHVLSAFREGFDAVVVFRCREGHCRNLIGNLDMDRRMNLLRTVLRSRLLDDARLRIVDISPSEGTRFAETVGQVYAELATLSDGKGAAR